ncbi:hypothetical protein Hanom_Chr02g00169471 [Helianthus anomalus]
MRADKTSGADHAYCHRSYRVSVQIYSRRCHFSSRLSEIVSLVSVIVSPATRSGIPIRYSGYDGGSLRRWKVFNGSQFTHFSV